MRSTKFHLLQSDFTLILICLISRLLLSSAVEDPAKQGHVIGCIWLAVLEFEFITDGESACAVQLDLLFRLISY